MTESILTQKFLGSPAPWIGRWYERVTLASDRDGSRPICHVYGWKDGGLIQQSNKNLIMAAPDLLVAVQQMLKSPCMSSDDLGFAALEKALRAGPILP